MTTPRGEDVYATLLLTDTYLPGALVLAHSLRDAGTTKKVAVLVTLDSVCAEAVTQLNSVFDYVIPVPRIQNDVSPANLDLMNRRDLRSAFTKVNLWKQTQFRKIVYIDADVVAYRAPDELFDLPHAFAAAPDIGWPDLFNTGVMVLTPDVGEYDALMAMAQQGISFDGADQGLLNMHFGDKYHRLPFTYNVTPSAHYQYLPAYRHFQSSINMVHFIGSDKPWVQGRDASTGSPAYNEMVGQWWSVYDRHYKPSTTTGADQSSQQPPEFVQYFVKGEFNPTNTYKLTASNPSLDLGSTSYGHNHQQYYQTPSGPSWDAQRHPPPTNAKPEAVNFHGAHYEMSRDTTPFVPPQRYPSPPRDMYNIPSDAHASRPRPIFPWEDHQPAPARVFLEPAPAPRTEPSGSSSHSQSSEAEMTTDTASVDLRTEPTTPTMPVIGRPPPPADPWTSFTRTNAWDEVPQIERYVDNLQKQHRRVRSRGKSPGNLGLDTLSKNSTAQPAGNGAQSELVQRGSKVTDFPSETERPSLPVTPAPVHRPKLWDGGGPNFNSGEDTKDGVQVLPAAEGVPQQADWDPTAQLQKLAKQQSEALLRKLSLAETNTEEVGDARVVSPQPRKQGTLGTGEKTILASLEKTIAEPAYKGPGLTFEKDEGYPEHDMAVALPSEEERDVLET